MEKFLKITVNGNVYDVKVEEVKPGQAPVQQVSAPVQPVQEVKPVAEVKPVEAPKEVANTSGTVKITAPMPGNVWKIKTTVGAKVGKHEVLLILEAMKMENEIVAPEAGTIVAIRVNEGNSVNPGQVMIEME